MFCKKCGADMPDEALVCGSCGEFVNSPATDRFNDKRDYTTLSSEPVVRRNVPSHLAFSIFTTLCCCLPFGIVAIVYASQVNPKLLAGNYAGAVEASKNAQKWCWIAVGIGIFGTVLSMILKGGLSGLAGMNFKTCPYTP